MNQIGIADPFNYGVSLNPANGQVAPWRNFLETTEYVPELFWPRSIVTFDQMRTDSQLAALLTAMMWGIGQLRFIIDENGAKPALVKEISEDLNLPVKGQDDQPLGRMKRRFSHNKFALQALLSVIYGHQYFEQNGEIVDGKWRLRKMFSLMPRTIAQINVMEDGGLANIVQWAGRKQIGNVGYSVMGGLTDPIPVDRLTAFVFQQEGYNWHGRSMMRDCFKDWLMKDRLIRIEAINHERAGGVPYAVAPMGAGLTEIEDLSQMMQQFRIGEDAGGAVPFGSEIKIAKGTGSDIDKTIMRYDQSMARRFMMMVANLAQGGQHVGSYALGDIFDDVWHIAQRHIAQWYCDTVNEHIIEDIVDWNYGEDEEYIPKLTWERTSEDSLGTDQLALLVQRGVIIVDEEMENAIRFKYQLPKRSTPRPNIIVGPGVPKQPQELAPGQTTPPKGEYPESANPVPATTTAAGAPSGAPSSETPAMTRASFFNKLKPRVMAKSDTAPFLVTVPNVPILHSGWEYPLSTGPKTFTPEDLRDIVSAANEDPSIPTPRLKIGHVDPRFNSGEFDGTPAFGKAVNLRMSETGTEIIADYVGVPKWLADIMPSAYPSRSIEGVDNVPAFAVYGANGYVSQTGKHWRFVVTALSLLGVEWPGITVLEDLPQYYGDTIPSDVQIVDPALVTATGGDPMKFPFRKEGTAASANLDDVRRAFYDDYCKAGGEMMWWWIQAILVDPNELVVEDDETGQLYKIPFSTGAAGAIDFGEAAPVRIDYIPDTTEANKAAASHVAATLAIGRTVAASWSNREESTPTPPTTASGGAMDPKQIRERLGLAADSSDDQVKEAIQELNAAAGIAPEQQVPAVTEPVTPPAAVTPAEPATPVVPAAAPAVPEGFQLVDSATLQTLVAASTASTDFITKQREGERGRLVAAAIGAGKIAPASREHWVKLLETDPNAEATLASLAPGLIPVELRGSAPEGGEGGDEISDELVSDWSSRLFPEVANARVAAKSAQENGLRPRILADSSYARR